MNNPISLFARIKSFRLRRFIFARHHRAPLINALGRWMEKNVAAFRNYDRAMTRNGEYWLMQTLLRDAPEGSVVFDVGGNIGEWSYVALKLNPKLNLHIFELVPSTFAQLKTNIAKLKKAENVTLNEHGLSDENGEVDVFLNSSKETAGLFHRAGLARSDKTTGRVMVGDDYMAQAWLTHIAFLKIDVEGAEIKVLQGLEKTLQAGRIDVLYFEYGEFGIAARHFLKDFYDILADDYEVGLLMPRWVEWRAYDKQYDNFQPAYYVAVRRDLTTLIEKLSG